MANPTATRASADLGGVIFRNALAATAGAWGVKLLNFAFIIYVVRTLGEVGLGRYATVVAFVGLFSVFVELGLAQFVERTIAQDRERAAALIWNLAALRLLLAGLGVVAITALAIALGYPGYLVLGILLYTLTFFLAAILVPLQTLTTSHEQFHLASMILLSGQLATIAFAFILLQFDLGFFALVFAGLIAMPIQIGLALWLVRRAGYGRIAVHIDPHAWKPLILASLPFGLTSLALTFNFNVDTVILGWFGDEATVGWYNASYRLVFNAVGIVGGFLVAMTPSLARVHNEDPERVVRWVAVSVRWLLLFALPVGVGLALLAPRVIALLYGRDYAPASTAFAILALDVPLLLLLSFFGNVTAAVERERPAARIFLGCAGANLVFNLALIPLFGITAAALVTVGTDLLCIGAFIVLLHATLPIRALARDTFRMALATGAMALVVLLVAGLPLALVILLGTVTYGALAIWWRLLDLRVLLGAARRIKGHRLTEARSIAQGVEAEG